MGVVIKFEPPLSENDKFILDDLNDLLETDFKDNEFEDAILAFIERIIKVPINDLFLIFLRNYNFSEVKIEGDQIIKDGKFVTSESSILDKIEVIKAKENEYNFTDRWVIFYRVIINPICISYRFNNENHIKITRAHSKKFSLEILRDTLIDLEQFVDEYMIRFSKEIVEQMFSLLGEDLFEEFFKYRNESSPVNFYENNITEFPKKD